jgi:hypothetical protein
MGIYAKLGYDEAFKRQLKSYLHALNRCLDDHNFLHYHRVQLAELLIQDAQLVTCTEFLTVLEHNSQVSAVVKAEEFITAASGQQWERLRQQAKALVFLLESKTRVSSAISLSRPA